MDNGYAPIRGMQMYYESQGEGGVPLIVAHGGFGTTGTMAAIAGPLSADRRVISVELQGHGHTGDVDAPFSWETFGEDLIALVAHLGLGPVDLLGFSLGGGASLRAAIQHPDVVRRLVLISTAHARSANYPETVAGMDQVSSAGFDFMRQTPIYTNYEAVAPDPAAFPVIMDKMGGLLRQDYDWSDEIRALSVPTMLIFGDGDSLPPAAAAAFHALLGGGRAGGGFDGSIPTESRLAILPGLVHYNINFSPVVAETVRPFLSS